MRIEDVHSYEELKRFLVEWSNFGGDPAYDFMGAFHLFLAILANLATHHNDGDIETVREFAPWLSQPQREFLDHILRAG